MQGLRLRNLKHGTAQNFGYGNQALVTAEFLCPRCGTFSEATGLSAPGRPHVAYCCRRCREMTMVEARDTSNLQNVTDYYPKQQLTVDGSVPEALRDDYLEAQRCFSVGAWRACAVMARRFVHSVMADKGAEGRDLYAQIKDLEAKHVLTPSLAQASQQVRVFGKYGAHPFDVSETGLEEMESDDAKAALGFCEMLIQYVYVLEAQIAASRAASETGGAKPTAQDDAGAPQS